MIGAEKRHILKMAKQKAVLHHRLITNTSPAIYTPLELYLDGDWQDEVGNPDEITYVTAAASSGGYRALLQLWSCHNPDTFKPNAHRQHYIIKMNTALVQEMVSQCVLPEELENKRFIIPHVIGEDVPDELTTLLGRNEALLMMQWLMRITGISENTARVFSDLMGTEHSYVIETIGNPEIPKASKLPFYQKLIETFFITRELTGEKEKEKHVSSMILGLDWNHSLGSRLEAAVAHYLKIPVYEMRLNAAHVDYDEFIDSFRLRKLIDNKLIHWPLINKAGMPLVCVEKLEPQILEKVVHELGLTQY